MAVQKSLKNSTVDVTYPLMAQILTAFFAWLITAITAHNGNLGDSMIALQLSSGGLWMWMMSVIVGWMLGNMSRSIALRYWLIGFQSRDAGKRRSDW